MHRGRQKGFMRQYELTYLVSDSVSDSDITKVSGKVNAAISGGKILKEDNWGRRKLAYNIQKQQFATYIMLHFELEPEHLSELEHELKVSPEVIRHLLIVKDFGKEKLELTADEIAATEDIEEAAGSEKSFEVVEGETEESRDLMAKREKGEDAEEANKDDPNRHLPDRQAGESSPQIDTNEESSTDIKKKVEGESKDEVDAKVEAKTEEGITEIEVELRFTLTTTDKEAIVNEVVARSQLSKEDIAFIKELEKNIKSSLLATPTNLGNQKKYRSVLPLPLNPVSKKFIPFKSSLFSPTTTSKKSGPNNFVKLRAIFFINPWSAV